MKWNMISTKMQSKGYSFSAEACRQHFQKLRKEANGGAPNTSTPNGRASKKPARPTSSGKKRKSRDDEDADNEDDAEQWSDEITDTPSKKKRASVMEMQKDFDEDEGLECQNVSSFKIEEVDGNGHRFTNLEQDDLYEQDY